jgi:hypothetical protein
MDRIVYYIFILFFILLAIYAWTSENVFLGVFSIIFLIVIVPFLISFSRRAATRRITYFDEFDIIVSNMFEGNKDDWSVRDENIKINCLNKEVNGRHYNVYKHRKDSIISHESEGIFTRVTNTVYSYEDFMSILFLEFDSQHDNDLAKDELLKTFQIDESKYRSFENKCVLIIENSSIFKDIQFKDNVHIGKFEVDKKVFAGVVIIGIVLVCAYFAMFSQSNVPIPDDAVKVYCDSSIYFQPDSMYLSDRIYDTPAFDQYVDDRVKSVEDISFDKEFNTKYLKINGSNNYSVSLETVLADLFKNTSMVESSQMNDNSNSNVDVEGIMVFYDENQNVVISEYVPVNITKDNKYYHITSFRVDINQTPVYSAYTLGGLYPNKINDLGHSAELHLILKSNANESSSEYYCYDLIFPAIVE